MEEKPDYDFKRKMVVRHSEIHGRGVFATEDIKKGELIERCPMVIMAHRMNYHKDPAIWSYMFTNTCPCEECKRHGGHFLMVMGYGQIYNHQDDNNASINFNLKEQYADVKAINDIAKDEEIFVNYGPNYFQNRNKISLGSQEKGMNGGQLGSCTSQVFKPK
jgi:hypothetical protein